MEIKVSFPARLQRPDQRNQTTLLVNDKKVWPSNDVFNPAELEGNVRLEIPNGTLEGKVSSLDEKDEEVTVFLSEATWEGKAGGLSGGISGCCTFEVLYGGFVVQSSTFPEERTVPYYLYEQVREVADVAASDEWDKQRVMRAIFRELAPPRAEIVEFEATGDAQTTRKLRQRIGRLESVEEIVALAEMAARGQVNFEIRWPRGEGYATFHPRNVVAQVRGGLHPDGSNLPPWVKWEPPEELGSSPSTC
jgi:hypothetical protein